MADTKGLTNNFGAPVPDNEHSLSAGERGPLLLQDYFLIEKLAHFDRERIPERVVHAKGAGAFGYFESNADMSAAHQGSFVWSGRKEDSCPGSILDRSAVKRALQMRIVIRGASQSSFTRRRETMIWSETTRLSSLFETLSNFLIWSTLTSGIRNRT
jgi:hypothetical protein